MSFFNFQDLGFISKRCGMLQGLMDLLSLCWKPFSGSSSSSNGYRGGGENHLVNNHNHQNNNNQHHDGEFDRDRLFWYKDTGKYASGDFSMAVVQANMVLEDQCQIESGPFGTFVGVYDGHGGPEAARYVCDHLFRNFQGLWWLIFFDLMVFDLQCLIVV